MNKIVVGIIGCGYWGPNLVRNFSELDNCYLKIVSDLKPGRLDFIKSKYPEIDTTLDYTKIISDPQINAVVIVTPVHTHYTLARQALENGKHVFVEKPFTATSTEALKLIDIADSKNLVLMSGHIFLYSPPVRYIKEALVSGKVGDIYYINSERINMGPPDSKVDVIWDLAVHDVYIISHFMGRLPQSISAVGRKYGRKDLIDMAQIQLKYENNTLVNIHVSWLSAAKSRIMKIMGANGSIIYNDLPTANNESKVKIYGPGIDNRISAANKDAIQLAYKPGDIFTPALENYEPLKTECDHFLRCISRQGKPLSDGVDGYNTVKILETISESVESGGKDISYEK